MTACERMTLIYEHQEPDRVPIKDIAWESTLARWHKEGLSGTTAWNRHFGLDRIVTLGMDLVDTSPRFAAELLEETDSYLIERDSWGITKKNFKPISSTFMHIDNGICQDSCRVL